MNKILLFLIVCSFGFNIAYAQKNLNDYKYVIVPTKYDFLDEDDKYRLNALTKFLFKKHNFNALMANQPFPEDLQNDNCLALRTNVIEHKGFMKTKLEIELRDCSNELVFKTKIGQTREKEYKKAYNLALRNAFESFQGVTYKYSGKTIETKEVKPELKVENIEVEPIKKMKRIKPKKQAKLTNINRISKQTEFKEPNIKEGKIAKTSKNVLYAQATDNGFQIVDNTPKVVMVLLESGKSNTYLVKGKDAVVYKEDGFWYISEYINGKLNTNRVSIKF